MFQLKVRSYGICPSPPEGSGEGIVGRGVYTWIKSRGRVEVGEGGVFGWGGVEGWGGNADNCN